jgi:hypothetical protein
MRKYDEIKHRTCKGISEISCWYYESDFVPYLERGCLDKLEVRMKVINALGQDPR